MPVVSIITPLHNKGAFIAETIGSVQAQTMPDWELIVVENGSNDGGPTVARAAADNDMRVKVIDAADCGGPGAARNFGLARASGEWVLFLDADDLISPDYLAARLAAEAGADIVVGPWEEFPDGRPGEHVKKFPNGWVRREAPKESAFCFAPWIVHAAIIRREHVLAFGGWDESLDSWPSEDCAFWFAALQKARLAWNKHSGALYRKAVHGSRDNHAADRMRAFEGCRANLRTNEQTLARAGKEPSSGQAALAFRMLRDQSRRSDDRRIRPVIRREAKYWLSQTSYRDPKMLAWRLIAPFL